MNINDSQDLGDIYDQGSMKSPSLQLVCRIRPPLTQELDNKKAEFLQSIQTTSKTANEVHAQQRSIPQGQLQDQVYGTDRTFRLPFSNPEAIFEFDYVADETVSQKEFYSKSVRPLARNLLNGRNTCILSQGPSQGGKTYSICGDKHKGLVIRTVQSIFLSINRKLQENPSDVIELKVSVMQVGREGVSDLLKPGSILKLRDTRDGMVVERVSEAHLRNAEDMVAVLRMASMNRRSESLHKQGDSRTSSHSSHMVVSLCLSYNGAETLLEMADLVSVDRSSDTRLSEVDRETLERDFANINKILSKIANSEVIGDKTYSNSVLTHLLKNSVGPTTDIVFICQIGPGSNAQKHSLNSLKQAAKIREFMTIEDPYAKYLEENELQGRVKADIYVLRDELETICFPLAVDENQVQEFTDDLRNKLHKMTRKLLRLMDSATPKEKRSIDDLITDAGEIQKHIQFVRIRWKQNFENKKSTTGIRATSPRGPKNARSRSPLAKKNKENQLSTSLKYKSAGRDKNAGFQTARPVTPGGRKAPEMSVAKTRNAISPHHVNRSPLAEVSFDSEVRKESSPHPKNQGRKTQSPGVSVKEKSSTPRFEEDPRIEEQVDKAIRKSEEKKLWEIAAMRAAEEDKQRVETQQKSEISDVKNSFQDLREQMTTEMQSLQREMDTEKGTLVMDNKKLTSGQNKLLDEQNRLQTDSNLSRVESSQVHSRLRELEVDCKVKEERICQEERKHTLIEQKLGELKATLELLNGKQQEGRQKEIEQTSKNNELESMLGDKKDQLEKVSRDLDDLRVKNIDSQKELVTTNTNLINEVEMVSKQKDDLARREQDVMLRCKDLEGVLGEKEKWVDAQLKEYRERLEEKSRENNRLHESMSNLKGELGETRQKLESELEKQSVCKNDYDRLSQKLNEQQNITENQTGKLGQFMKKLEEQTLVLSETLDENRDLKRQAESLSSLVDTLRNENGNYLALLDNEKNLKNDILKDLSEKERRMSDQDREIDYITRDTNQNKGKMEEQATQLKNKEFEQNNSQLKVAELTPLVEKNKLLELKVDNLRKEQETKNRDLDSGSKELTSRLLKKEAEVGELKAELAFLRKEQNQTIQELEKKAERFNEDVNRYKQETQHKDSELLMLRREVDEKTRELIHFKEQLAVTHESSERMAETLEKTERKVREIMRKNDERSVTDQDDRSKEDKVSKRLQLLEEINSMIRDHRSNTIRHDFRDTQNNADTFNSTNRLNTYDQKMDNYSGFSPNPLRLDSSQKYLNN